MGGVCRWGSGEGGYVRCLVLGVWEVDGGEGWAGGGGWGGGEDGDEERMVGEGSWWWGWCVD